MKDTWSYVKKILRRKVEHINNKHNINESLSPIFMKACHFFYTPNICAYNINELNALQNIIARFKVSQMNIISLIKKEN